MLAVQGVRFRWPQAGSDCVAVDALAVAAGSTLFLHGPSGGGKSTLLGLLAGVLLPRAGSVSLLGTPWHSLSGARRDAFRADHVGYIFQQFNLLPYLSVVDNVLLPCRFSALRRRRAEGSVAGGVGGSGVVGGVGGSSSSAASALASAESLLRQVGLEPALWRRPAARLSVGQQQRVAAARALIGRPELVIADEPTSALDARLRDGFMDLLMAECRAAGSALVFVSHDERLAGRFDRQLALSEINAASLSPDEGGSASALRPEDAFAQPAVLAAESTAAPRSAARAASASASAPGPRAAPQPGEPRL